MAGHPRTLGLFEAKTHLSALLERVARGEEITITKHGTPIARLVPVVGACRDPRVAVEKIRALRKGVRLKGATLRELIEEGRRG